MPRSGEATIWSFSGAVAVKMPKPSRLDSAEAFMAEARRVAELDHPNIVPIFDVGREGESCYLVFPFMKNGSPCRFDAPTFYVSFRRCQICC